MLSYKALTTEVLSKYRVCVRVLCHEKLIKNQKIVPDEPNDIYQNP